MYLKNTFFITQIFTSEMELQFQQNLTRTVLNIGNEIGFFNKNLP